MSRDEYVPRLTVEISADLHKRMTNNIPWGLKSKVMAMILEDLMDLVEEHGQIVLAAILTREIGAKQVLKELRGGASTSKMSKANCVGCRDNLYNGNNDVGVKECWNFKDAKIEKRKRVPLDQRPPWTQEAELLPSCYAQKGYVIVAGDRTY